MSVAGRDVVAFRNGSTVTSPDEEEDSAYIDFSNAGLYLVALQMVSASVAVACVSVVVNWVSGDSASAIRTFAVCTACGFGALVRPARVGRVPGLSSVFNALRPCTGIYLLSLASGQLVHSCMALQTEPTTPAWRDVVFNLVQIPLVGCGIWRALNPVSSKDKTVVVAGVTMLALALLPLPGQRGDGPLCMSPSLGQAGLRLLRALLFSLTYSFHVFSSAPEVLERGDIFLSATRATAASVWVLGAHAIVMPLVVVQIGIVIYQRMSISSNGASEIASLQDGQGRDPDHQHYHTVSNTSDGEDVAALEEGSSAFFKRTVASKEAHRSLFANLPIPSSSPASVASSTGQRVACDLSNVPGCALSETSTVDTLEACALAAHLGGQAPHLVPVSRGARGWREVGATPLHANACLASGCAQSVTQPKMTTARMAEIAASLEE